MCAFALVASQIPKRRDTFLGKGLERPTPAGHFVAPTDVRPTPLASGYRILYEINHAVLKCLTAQSAISVPSRPGVVAELVGMGRYETTAI